VTVFENFVFEPTAVRERLLDLTRAYLVTAERGRIGVAEGTMAEISLLRGPQRGAWLGPMLPEQLGSSAFRQAFGVRLNYMAGGMARAVSSIELVTSLGKAGLLGSFGAAGLEPAQIEAAILALKHQLPNGPFAINLIHAFDRPEVEQATVDLCLKHGVRTVEASAFMELAPTLVQFRASGFTRSPDGTPQNRNNLIVKLSRPEIARQVMQPPPADMLHELVAAGRLRPEQASMAATLPVATAVTVEADSGGHTDFRQLISLLPIIIALRDEMIGPAGFAVAVGAAGGIGTPAAVAAGFSLGADYVVTGSVNQACLEAGTSDAVKRMLSEATLSDVAIAPAADMFELGSKVQVLKRGTLFPVRARRLDDLFQRYQTLDEIPAEERSRLERQVFGCDLQTVWRHVQTYFQATQPAMLERAARDPRHQMALVFRWYLGSSSAWAIDGLADRSADYQIWCGSAMGAFNAWTQGTRLAEPRNRRVVDVAEALMVGAAYLSRLNCIRALGVDLPSSFVGFAPADAAPGRGSPRPPEVAAVSGATAGPAVQDIRRFLVRQIAEQGGLAQEEVDVRASFESYGLSSPKALVVLSRLETWLGRKLSPTLIWNFPTIEALAARLAKRD
jgi:trans-AT polyketide synthase/acyltransferase/oxidoreductase domain-containing protein